MRPICIKCKRFLKPKRNGFTFTEGYREDASVQPGNVEPEKWKPYKIWSGDLWECPGCGVEIISGVARDPIAEYFSPNFARTRENLKADQFQVNDI